ncbi:hypothetical protein ACJJTC_006671 [Scirpophaga incertulas]
MEKVFYLSLLLILLVTVNNNVSGKKHGKQSKAKDGNNGGKIVGGYNTTIEDVPYQAYLLLLRGIYYYQCGGSIISSSVVLTAAHCLVGIQRVHVRIGSTLANSGGTMYNTSSYLRHPLYNPLTSDYDVAIVKTQRAMKLDGTTSKVISLPDAGTEVPTGTDLLVSGWGDTSENGNLSETLMAVNVPTVSLEDCRKAYGESAITERMICAGLPEGGKDSCQGDSGGPAVDVASAKQVGIVSFGSGCARPGIPGVYTNVSSVRKWIRLVARV